MTCISLSSRVARTIRDQGLFNPGDTIIVALSGGADSCALLDILAGLTDLPAHLVAAHLNHCLRGRESDADELFAREMAGRYGLPFEVLRVDVKALAEKHGYNLEDAGRRARLTFLEEVRTRRNAQAIALAHHADDQAETVLMRLMRGSGMTGLSAMSGRNGNRIRPLLGITRAEIEDHLQKRGLSYREDSSNLDTAFLRNRIRHELLPLLEQYNPSIRKNLATTASLLSDEDDLLSSLTDAEFKHLAKCAPGAAAFDISGLLQLHPALQRRIMRQAIAQVAGDLRHISLVNINDVLALLQPGPPNRSITLPGSLVARRAYDSLVIEFSSTPPTDTYTITAPGHYPLWDGISLEISIHEPPERLGETKPDTVWFDLDKVPFPCQVRTARPGDRIAPLGMDGTKKVKDIFIDAKIPLSQRRSTPLVFSKDMLIWIAGLRISGKAALDRESTNVVRMRVLYN